jgi:MFS transporter, OPA family, glycerol-3-phosphate transporter
MVDELRPGRDWKYKLWRWRIFFITWLAYGGFYLTRKSFSVAKIGLGDDPDFMMSNATMGAIDFAYLTAYAVGQFLWGAFGDRFGTRKIVLVGMLGSVIAGFAMGLSPLVLFLGVFFCIQGFCQSSGWAPLTKNVGYWFAQKERGRVMGWWCTNYAIGGAVASAIAGFAADQLGHWRYAFFVPAGLLFCIWLLFILLQRNRPKDVGLPPIEEYQNDKCAVLTREDKSEEVPDGSWKTTVAVLKNPMVILMGVIYFLLKPTRYAILFWGPKYLNERLNTGMGESALISACFELGGPLGVLFGGYVSDLVFKTKRMPISIICLFALACVLFSFNHLAAYESKWMIAVLLFSIGFLLYIPDSILSGTAAIDFGTKKGASTAAGFVNGLGSVGAILGGSLPGIVSQRWGWNVLFTSLAIAVTLAAFLLLPKWNAVPATTEGKA